MGKLREARLPTLLDIEKFTIPPGAMEEGTKMETYNLKSVPSLSLQTKIAPRRDA